MSHNQNNDIMKPTDYIEWDNLKNIPFFLCQVVEDKENKDIDIYYLGKRVFHDYDHVGHYMRSAIILFRRIKNRTADWVNLQNLWTLRNCIRENYNHGIGVDSLIYGEDFDGENPETLTPLTKKRFDLIVKRIQSKNLCFGDYFLFDNIHNTSYSYPYLLLHPPISSTSDKQTTGRKRHKV